MDGIGGIRKGYDPSNIDIDGGTIDNAVIGGTTPVAGTFTDVTSKNGSIILLDDDIVHGMTGVLVTSGFGLIQPISGTIGGLDIYGLTDADQAGALRLTGIIGAADPTDTYPALWLRGGKKNGTGWQALGAAETVFKLSNYTTDLVTVFGNGLTKIPSLYVGASSVVGAGYSFELHSADDTAGYTTLLIRRNKDGGSYNNDWYHYMPANSKDYHIGDSSYDSIILQGGTGNIGFNTSTFGTSAAKVFAMASGTAPTTSPADTAQIWVQDKAGVAGKASLYMRNEAGISGPVAHATIQIATHSASESATADTMYGDVHKVTGAHTITLPDAVIRMSATFRASTAAAFSIKAGASDHFEMFDGTALDAGDKITSGGTKNEFVTIYCESANTWIVFGQNGAFTDGGA